MIASAGVLVLGIVGFYLILIPISSHEIAESLQANQLRVVKHLERYKTYPDLFPLVEVKEVRALKPPVLSDTTIYDAVEGEAEVFKQLVTYEKINGKIYRISVRSMALEKNDIYMTIFFSVVAMLALLLLILFWLNKRIAYDIWEIFYQNLKTIKSFSIKDNKPVRLKESGIEEFDELKTVLEQMSQQIIDDYNTLKQFSENAAHEMQTPLSVIRSKLEVLLNDKNLTREQSAAIQIVYQTVIRLSKLNHSLLLLTKIENRQYDSKKLVNLEGTISEILLEFGEIVAMKKLRLHTDLQEIPAIEMDTDLARILIENLLNNAVKYTESGGGIIVKLSKKGFSISNTGREKLKNSDRIFERFVKENQSASSVGLGLSIVKEICLINDFDIAYGFSDGMHVFTVSFLGTDDSETA